MGKQSFYRQNMPIGNETLRCISIQSAKGGVGKTLISLLVGNLLRKKEIKARVLILDLDFCGTSLGDLLENGEPVTHLHHIPIFSLTQENNEWNILSLFQRHLKGEALSGSLNRIELQNILKKKEDCIWFIPSGSFIPDGTVSSNLLFDSIHAEWFCDFLFDLMDYVHDLSDGAPSDGPLFCILDNAPGWSELLPVLQGQLLKWGVHRTKFIQVASLDEMDIRSSLTILETLFKEYLKIYFTKDVYVKLTDLQEPETDKKITSHILEWLAETKTEYFDQNYLSELLGEAPEYSCTIKTHVDRNIAHQIFDFMGLVINKIFPTVNLNLVSQYIDKRGVALLDRYRKGLPNKKMIEEDSLSFFTVLPVVPFSYDPAMTLIFQERFLKGGDVHRSSVKPTPNSAAKERTFNDEIQEIANLLKEEIHPLPKKYEEGNWKKQFVDLNRTKKTDYESLYQKDVETGDIILQSSRFKGKAIELSRELNRIGLTLYPHMEIMDIVLLDHAVYNDFYSEDADSHKRRLVGVVNFDTFSHLLRGLSLLFNMFRFCVRCLSDLYTQEHIFNIPTFEHEDLLRINIENRIQRIKEDGKESADWSNEWSILIDILGPDKGKADEDLFYKVVSYTAKSVKGFLTKAEEVIFRFFFNLFVGILVITSRFPDENMKRKRRGIGEEKEEWTKLERFCKDLFYLVIECWKLVNECDNLAIMNSSFREKVRKIYKKTNRTVPIMENSLEINRLYLEMRAYKTSLQHREKAFLLLQGVGALTNKLDIQEMTSWYIRSSLSDVFKGHRTDVSAVLESVLKVLLTGEVDTDERVLGNVRQMENNLRELLFPWLKGRS